VQYEGGADKHADTQKPAAAIGDNGFLATPLNRQRRWGADAIRR
jgi:hypothetical protein